MIRRVLMTADAVGGVYTYALELAEAFGRIGIEVALAIMGPAPDRAQRAAAARVPNLRLFAGDYPLEWMDSPWEGVDRAGDWLLELEARLAPEVVHLNGYVHAVLPFRARVLVVAHSCVTSWFYAVRGEAPPPAWDTYRRRVAAGLAAADLVAAPTRWMLDTARRLYEVCAPGRAIPNGRSPARFAPAPKEPFVLAAGRVWDEAKNLGALDACADRVPWPILVAGKAVGPRGGGAGAAALARVRLLGPLAPAELAGQLARAAIYALPARYEPFGLSAVEAALSGCALVLGDIPSLREVWADDAVWVPPGDPAAIGDAIAGLCDDEGRRLSLAARARARAATLTPGRMAAGYLALYQELAAGGRRRACAS